eukprot:1794640-Amphidinium_carterae.2
MAVASPVLHSQGNEAMQARHTLATSVTLANSDTTWKSTKCQVSGKSLSSRARSCVQRAPTSNRHHSMVLSTQHTGLQCTA